MRVLHLNIVVETNEGSVIGRCIRVDSCGNPLEIVTLDFIVYEKDTFTDLFYPKY